MENIKGVAHGDEAAVIVLQFQSTERLASLPQPQLYCCGSVSQLSSESFTASERSSFQKKRRYKTGPACPVPNKRQSQQLAGEHS